jgi:peptidoglycan-associated lipoprotein
MSAFSASSLKPRGASLALGLTLAAVLAGCSSVKLDDVPVEDRSGAPVSAIQPGNAQGGQGGAAGQRDVTGVQVPKTDDAATAMSRVVYFDYDSFEVKAEFAQVLEANARHLSADRSRKVVLQGHTDERGGREYNLALGQKRAEAVRRSLSLLGVSESQMEPVSFGEEKPAEAGLTEAAYAKNRRVEFSYR